MIVKSFLSKCVVILTLLIATSFQANALPQIKWLKMNHNFGAFSEDLGEVEYTFRGINVGDEDLVIYTVRPNCGCVVTDNYAGREYAPGDTIDIRITYHATGRPGRFTKKINLQSNADPSKQTLVIGGTVIGSINTLKTQYPVEAGKMRIHTSSSLLGEILKGHTGGAYIKCYNNSPDTIYPQVKATPEYLKAIVEPSRILPGESFVISLTCYSNQCQQWGLVTDTISIYPDRNSDFYVPVTVTCTIKENFKNWTEKQLADAPHIAVEPSMIDLGRIPFDYPISVHNLTIRNTGKSDLILRRVWSADQAISMKCKSLKVKPGASTQIEVSVDPSKSDSNEILNARILIIANDPDSPSTVVRVVGEFIAPQSL